MSLSKLAGGWIRAVLLIALTFVAASAYADTRDTAAEISPEQTAFFETYIRPILVQHCYECHSSESGEDLEGSLLLDSRWGWSTGGDSGPAIVPGDPDDSLIMQAVGYEEDVVSAMPPSSKLPDDQIELLKKWIRDGAPDPREKVESESHAKIEEFDLQDRFDQHWSWRPIQNLPAPVVADSSWPQNFIDSFVLHQLESAGIQPAVPADKAIWIRRTYFDLIGLPPTIDQIDAFLADESSNAREKVVDELLESQAFGEKWARHWMDLVRYAETYGHEFDYAIPRPYEYRDYLIRAFNADVPYDQLIREHIAGDLIQKPRQNPAEKFNESIIGTGYWYLHEATHSPTDVLKNESDVIDNQIDVFGKTFLGLTVACARCHDHKFDAISTADYYALSGYIQSSCRQLYPLDPNQAIAKTVDRLTSLQTQYAAAKKKGHGPFDNDRGPKNYMVAAAKLMEDGAGDSSDKIQAFAKKTKLDADLLHRWVDGLQKAKPSLRSNDLLDVVAFIAQQASVKEASAKDAIVEHLESEAKQIDQYDGTLFADFGGGKLPDGWSTSGQAFQIVSDHSRFVPIDQKALPESGTVDSAVYGKRAAGILRSPTFQISTRQIHLRLRATGDARVRLIIDNYQMTAFNALLFKGTELNKKSADTKGKWAWKSLGKDLRKYVGHNAYLEIVDDGDATVAIDEIWFSNESPPPEKSYFATQLRRYHDAPDAFWRSISEAYRSSAPNRVVNWLLENQLVDLSRVGDATTQIEREAASLAETMPRPRYILAMAEGTHENSHVYVRGSSAMLGQELQPRNLQALGGHTGDRLQLANEIASVDNPLVARVLVNRLWHHLMGRGIVPTTDDFGPQGQPASHPDLLDALAINFVDNGWSIKSSIRTIVLSQTYAQSSVTHPSNDAQLIANLDPTNSLLYRMRIRRLPAESIRDQILTVSQQLESKPFGESVPTYRTPFMTGRGARSSGPMDGNGRRSIYLAVYRNFLNPFMSAFDVPNPFGPKGRRSVSNVPAQSLTMLNDPFILDQAKKWATELLRKDQSAEERIKTMIRTAHGVQPSEPQVDALLQFTRQHPDAGKNEQQVWADVAHMLFNMKAFYFLR